MKGCEVSEDDRDQITGKTSGVELRLRSGRWTEQRRESTKGNEQIHFFS